MTSAPPLFVYIWAEIEDFSTADKAIVVLLVAVVLVGLWIVWLAFGAKVARRVIYGLSAFTAVSFCYFAFDLGTYEPPPPPSLMVKAGAPPAPPIQFTPKPPAATPMPRRRETPTAGTAIQQESKGDNSPNIATAGDSSPIAIAPITLNAPQGIAIGGGNVTNPIVNNYVPEPNLTWTQEQSKVDGSPVAVIIFSLDHAMEIPAFGAFCDRPCESVDLTVAGFSHLRSLKAANSDNFTGYVFFAPRPLGARVRVRWIIKSLDGSPIEIQSVVKIPLERLPQEFR